MERARLGRLALVASLLPMVVMCALPAADATVVDQQDGNIIVELTSPGAGERVSGSVNVTGYAADRRSPVGSGINEDDIQLWLDDISVPEHLIGYAAGGRPSPEAAAALGPQAAVAGFARVWDTCAVPAGPHQLVVWVSSVVAPGAPRNFARVDVVVDPCQPAASGGRELAAQDCRQEPTLRSLDTRASTTIEFVNRGPREVRTYWLNYEGARVAYRTLAAGESYTQQTYVTHPWVVTDASEQCLGIYLPMPTPSTAVIAN